MRRISYAGESFVTSDGVADALLRLIAALGVNHTSAAVEIPVFHVRQGGRMLGGALSAGLSRANQGRAGLSRAGRAGFSRAGISSAGRAGRASLNRVGRAGHALAGRRSLGGFQVEMVRLVAGPSTAIVSRVEEVGHAAIGEEFSADALAAIERLDEYTDSLGGARAIIHAHPHGEVGFDYDGLESI
ncbi:hypothetical protein [Subtercola endophyticus]|uniref:hypothetical protein n=1 Tax=Subtercola endophyticus TaxID=2895559 RepID=UPI001E48D085|nr:hypothetical protein [Subtercola endophyticus]UFS59704.1 hypothetical protein LQ955_02580 [Subtercola endophyticus]